jgi:hypothetical protein
MELVDDVTHVESCFGPFGDGVSVVPNIPQAQKLFWTHPMVLLGYEAQVETCFVQFGDSANIDAR